MPNWPTALPQRLSLNGNQVSPIDNAVAIDVESGEPLTRLRFTGDMQTVDGTITIDGDQLDMLRNFWKYDLKRGTLRFNWEDPYDGTAVEMLFRQAPSYTSFEPDAFRADLKLFILP
jgi:hypothetical protein